MQRTSQQNRGAHKGFQLIADALNDAGLDMKAVLKPEVDIPWTTASVKEYLFRPIMKAMTTKTSTKELEKTGEIEIIWETLMRHLMEKHHIEYIPFPSSGEMPESLKGYGSDKPNYEYPPEEGNIPNQF